MSRFKRPLLLALLQALGAGALLPLAFAPINIWLLELLSVGWLYALLRHRPAAAAAWLGLAYGVGAFGVGTSWIYVSIHDFGNAPPAVAGIITAGFTLLLASYLALQCYIWRRWITRSWCLIPGFAALWVLGELLRGWLFTGFPWLYLGYPHVTSLFSGFAPLFGVLGISFAVALSAAILGEMSLRYLQLRSSIALARTHWPTLFLIVWGLGSLSSRIYWTTPMDVAPLKVGIAQGNIEQTLKFRSDYQQQSLDRYAQLSADLWQDDLVIWPETAIPLVYQREPALLAQLQAQAASTNTTLISGIFFEDAETIHNSLAAFGAGSGVWHKQKLVPFGEYVPLRSVFASLLQLFDLPMSSLSPGPSAQAPLLAGPYTIAPFICYEVVYPDFVRRYGGDAALLLTVSNDTWFGSSWGPHQHLQMAAMRARELGRYMVRATNNGISALIDTRGNIFASTPQFEATVLRGEVQPFTGRTPFARWGHWPVLLLCGLILAANFFPLRRLTLKPSYPL